MKDNVFIFNFIAHCSFFVTKERTKKVPRLVGFFAAPLTRLAAQLLVSQLQKFEIHFVQTRFLQLLFSKCC